MNNIYGLDPINKTAAIVTSQSGCASDGTLTADQERENIVSRIKQLDMLIANAPRNSEERKALGIDKFNLCTKVKELKLMPSTKKVFLSDYIIQLAKEELTSFQWKRIVKRAEEMLSKQCS